MGARVHSFDFDEKSVACALELRRRYFPNDANWTVERGSALDRGYVESLGQFDVCYSWGVLHHTGQLWRALFNAQAAVAPGGLLYIAIYNDQGLTSAVWGVIKRIYCSNALGMAAVTSIFYPLFFLAGLFLDLLRWRNPAQRYREHRKYRGMSLIHDWKDWLGGLPYEPAQPRRIEGFLHNLGFGSLRFERPVFGFGNCQYVFRRRL
jgi:2-polyprenyl-6-hydroxyphenyl methylase/3-demethylubiquinone-9 3-methyltransferase